MKMTVCVIAHYDPDCVWDENFLQMLEVVARVVDRIVLVTTAMEIPDLPVKHAAVELVRRPNIGYDFYSYRVGLSRVLSDKNLEGVFLLNSSLILLHAGKFEGLLRNLADKGRRSAVRGVTASTQIAWHLQSYLLYFDIGELPCQWLQSFFSKVQPVNTKFEVVLAYEIGLGREITEQNLSVNVLFKPGTHLHLRGTFAWMRTVAQNAGRFGWFTLRPWRAMSDVNWVHFGADALAWRYGFVKAEVLRSNPHQLNLDNILSNGEESISIGVQQSVRRTQQYYFASGNGLTELVQSHQPEIFQYQFVESRSARKQGAKVAVVVHLFYLDLLEEILDYLENILEPVDLFITTPFAADVWKILNFVDLRRKSVSIFFGENRGRDVGPFITLFRSGVLSGYEAVLKLHSKKSRYSDQGSSWRKQIYRPLCGDSVTVLRTLKLLRSGEVGIVGPGNFFLSHDNFWGANRDSLARILRSADIDFPNTGPELGFFAGTMFWFVPHALAAIERMSGTAVAFDAEGGKQDGTLAHAWERAFCLLARAAGYRVTSLSVSGVELFTLDNKGNRVPVLADV